MEQDTFKPFTKKEETTLYRVLSFNIVAMFMQLPLLAILIYIPYFVDFNNRGVLYHISNFLLKHLAKIVSVFTATYLYIERDSAFGDNYTMNEIYLYTGLAFAIIYAILSIMFAFRNILEDHREWIQKYGLLAALKFWRKMHYARIKKIENILTAYNANLINEDEKTKNITLILEELLHYYKNIEDIKMDSRELSDLINELEKMLQKINLDHTYLERFKNLLKRYVQF